MSWAGVMDIFFVSGYADGKGVGQGWKSSAEIIPKLCFVHKGRWPLLSFRNPYRTTRGFLQILSVFIAPFTGRRPLPDPLTSKSPARAPALASVGRCAYPDVDFWLWARMGLYTFLSVFPPRCDRVLFLQCLFSCFCLFVCLSGFYPFCGSTCLSVCLSRSPCLVLCLCARMCLFLLLRLSVSGCVWVCACELIFLICVSFCGELISSKWSPLDFVLAHGRK